MAPKIFATGTTGYVGGTVLHDLLTQHPDWESAITCLVRSDSRARALTNAYPSVALVSGTLEDSRILEEQAAKADIVLHFASSDHVGGAEAIKAGMERGAALKGKEGKAAYWIHTSGTDILLAPQLLNGNKIEESASEVKVYDDWDGIKELISFPQNHSHRPCDTVPLSISSPNIKTAIVCPPTIFGKGSGTGSTRSIQVYNLAHATLERGSGILIPGHEEGKKKTFWPNIHVNDLAKMYLKVIESAVDEMAGRKGKASWGAEGYYFAENGVHYWQDVANVIAEEAYKQGFLKSRGVTKLEDNENDILKSIGPAIWNLGASCKYVRAKQLFGWGPMEKELMDEIAEIVRSEAELGGFKKA